MVNRIGSTGTPSLNELTNETAAKASTTVKQTNTTTASSDVDKALVAKAVAYLKNQGGQQGIAASQKDFAVTKTNRDNLGLSHVRVQQLHNGLKVVGGEMIVHMDRGGNVSSTTGSAIEIPKNFSTYPRITSDDAVRIASGNFIGPATETPKSELVIYTDQNGKSQLAYHVQLTNLSGNDPSRMNYYIDAKTGRMIDHFNALPTFCPHCKAQGLTAGSPGAASIKTDQVAQNTDFSPGGNRGIVPAHVSGSGTSSQPAAAATEQKDKLNPFDWLKNLFKGMFGKKPAPGVPAKGTGNTENAGKVDINLVKNSDGSFTLKDTQRGGSQIFDAEGKFVQIPILQRLGKPVTAQSGDLGDSNKIAASAAYNTAIVWDMLKEKFGRNSIDNRGLALNSNINVGKDFNNAFWNGSFMSYGNGDGKVLTPLAGALDVAAHEIAHGLTQNTANLTYAGESGGINEAMSDIFGAYAEYYASKKNPNIKANWLIGEQVYTPGKEGDALRYMDHPTKDAVLDANGKPVKYIPDFLGRPSKIVKFGEKDYDSPKAFELKSIDHFSQFKPGLDVHFSSGLVNNAFYLLANGGINDTSKIAVEGIGIEKGADIYYRALTTYMLPNTNFKGAREATIKAATDLYGANSVEVQRVKDSWRAVGVE